MALVVPPGGVQSALDAHGPVAADIAALSWLLFAGAAIIFVAVFVLAGYALFAQPARRRWLAKRGFVVGAGIVFPILALTALLVYEFTQPALAARGPVVRIDVAGEQWWWRVRYPDGGIVTANEIRVPVGRRVELVLHSDNVIHSFWVPGLAGKLDMIPGRVNRLELVADDAGEFRGQCAEFCGIAHAWMGLYVIAEPAADFDAWRAAQSAPRAAPADDVERRREALFLARGCGVCHTVRGTEADGVRGPDLTHVASRHWLGAARLRNTPQSLRAWIASSQHYKPGNLMPAFDVLPADDVSVIAAYVASLR